MEIIGDIIIALLEICIEPEMFRYKWFRYLLLVLTIFAIVAVSFLMLR